MPEPFATLRDQAVDNVGVGQPCPGIETAVAAGMGDRLENVPARPGGRCRSGYGAQLMVIHPRLHGGDQQRHQARFGAPVEGRRLCPSQIAAAQSEVGRLLHPVEFR